MKVLVVDDSKLARFSLVKIIRGHNPSAELFEAENGAIGVELFRAEKPNIVFLDLTMPVMDGYEALKRILEIDPKAQVVVVSADIQTQAQELVLQIGAKMMVPKPINPEKMLVILQQLNF